MPENWEVASINKAQKCCPSQSYATTYHPANRTVDDDLFIIAIKQKSHVIMIIVLCVQDDKLFLVARIVWQIATGRELQVVLHPSLRKLFIFPWIKKIKVTSQLFTWRKPDVSDDTHGRQLAEWMQSYLNDSRSL